MADIRIKDLATTATTTASDDFMAVDGAINGTRKLSAAAPSFLTSVTTPSLTSPAASNLTLGTGTGGTALTLASSTLAATFAGALTVTGDTSIGTNVFKIDTTNTRILLGLAGALQGDTLEIAAKGNGGAISLFGRAGFTNESIISFRANGANTQKAFIQGADAGLLLGTGSTTKLSIAASTGDVSLASTTAGSSGAGALVVQGGISAGNTGSATSYFGGAVSVNAGSGPTLQINNSTTDQPYIGFYRGGTIRSSLQLFTDNDFRFYASNLTTYAGISAGAATFSGAVTAAVVTSTGAGYTNSGFQITNTSASRTTGLFLTNAGATSIRDVTGAADLFTITTAGNATFAGAVTTSAPTGGAGAWELGIANTVTPTSPNRTITIEIGGTVYYLAAKTTND